MKIDYDPTTDPGTPYEELRDEVRTGDILLCSGKPLGSRLVRWFTRSKWSHVGVVVVLPEIESVCVMEAVTGGVRMIPLSHYVKGRGKYKGDLVIARHKESSALVRSGITGDAYAREWVGAVRWGVAQLGKPYNFGQIMKIAHRITWGRMRKRAPVDTNRDEYICSEFVDCFFRSAGIWLDYNERGFTAPDDIARDRDVNLVAKIA